MSAVLVQGGRLVDPDAGTTEPGDVLLRDGTVVAVGRVAAADAEGAEVVDAAGLHVAPAFLDIHTHVFQRPDPPDPSPGRSSGRSPGRSPRFSADRVGVRQGVGCLVDAGSSGAATMDEFDAALAGQRTGVYALVNIGSPGQSAEGGHSSRPELVSLAATVEAVERHRDRVRGIKVQASHAHTGGYGMTAVALARKAADLTGLPLMMHVGNAPPVLDDVLPYLHEGDVVTHAYHGKVGGALTYGGKPLPALVEAVARGVVVDIGHGSASFAFATAERALEAGLPVHSISTDLHRGNLDRTVFSLARTMTKLVHLGLPVADAVRAVTSTPAKALRLDADGFGSLAVGRPANLTLFRLADGPLELTDAEGEVRRTERYVEPVAAYVGGERFDVDAPL